jgi:hypothetical protein
MSLKGFPSVKVDQAKNYKDLEVENTRLKKLVANLSLREVMLKEVIKGSSKLTSNGSPFSDNHERLHSALGLDHQYPKSKYLS